MTQMAKSTTWMMLRDEGLVAEVIILHAGDMLSIFTNQEHEDTLLVLRQMVVAIPWMSHCNRALPSHNYSTLHYGAQLRPILSQRADEDEDALQRSGKWGKKSRKAVKTASSKYNVDLK
ncbi:hypothetical protein P692DRAFT_20823203 [Suillus brevipes Sb2]|nr:hypothetical protein P692DRAFT_20823203 [Suillus brevipes Sb2]